MFAVTGASGQLGRLVVEKLLDRVDASEVVALVRNPETVADLADKGVILRQADYNDAEGYANALQGVERLLLISSNAVGSRVPQHKTVIDAAVKAGVKLLAYTSILQADVNPMILAAEHKVTEADIVASGLDHIFLRNGWYAENFDASIGAALQFGAHSSASGDGRYTVARRADYAEAAAIALTNDKVARNRAYELGGAVSFKGAEFADMVSKVAGKPVHWNPIVEEQQASMLIGIGLPEGFARALADADNLASDGWLEANDSDLETLLGRPVATMEAYIAGFVANS